MSEWYIAQANMASLRYPLGDPRLIGFEDRIDEINALAESSPGFVWRFADESGGALYTRPFEDERTLFNMSVWECVEALRGFVYRSHHRDLIQARRSWFEADQQPSLALWWVRSGQLPGVSDAVQRLRHLREHGPTPYAFSFGRLFEPQDSAA